MPSGLRRRLRQRHAYEQAQACCMMSNWGVRSVVDDYGVPARKVHSVATSFPAWHWLVRHEQLARDEALELLAGTVAAARAG